MAGATGHRCHGGCERINVPKNPGRINFAGVRSIKNKIIETHHPTEEI
jgi:hypothetical protein